MAMKRSPVNEKIAAISLSESTIAYYNSVADQFWAGTQDHDVDENRKALIEHMPGAPPHDILDFGCGPGRDLLAFRELGHRVVGLDGSERFVAMAAAYSECEVWHQDFLSLRLPEGRFDGVFANASLFHIPSRRLPQILKVLYDALRPQGILFCSNPRGNDEEGVFEQRYGVYYSYETWTTLLVDAQFSEVRHYYRPSNKPREQQRWLASVWRKH